MRACVFIEQARPGRRGRSLGRNPKGEAGSILGWGPVSGTVGRSKLEAGEKQLFFVWAASCWEREGLEAGPVDFSLADGGGGF